jgi:signal recognition particle GTPase
VYTKKKHGAKSMTTAQLVKVQSLTASLTTEDIKEQLLNDNLDIQVADWLLDELQGRLSEDEFIEFCDSY